MRGRCSVRIDLKRAPNDLESLRVRRAQLELLFWAAREVLKLAALVALTVYLVVSVANGHPSGYTELLDALKR